jgi:hypothetical protein
VSTAAPPISRPGRWPSARLGRTLGWAAALLLALLLLVATVATPRPQVGCGDGEGASTGDVTAVGNYPRPLTFGGATLYPGQLVFADVVAKRTRWDLAVIRAQVFNEMNGAAALGRVRAHNNNWLNVGYFDHLQGGGAYQTSSVWRDPVRAGNATADWIQGKRETLNSKGADSIRDAYEKGATAGPLEQVRLLQGSGWASSRYPDLPGIYQRIASGEGGKAASGTQIADAAPTGSGAAAAREDLTAGAGSDAGATAAGLCNAAAPVGGGIAAAGEIAHKYLGATGPSQMPGFTGGFPAGQWCSWFVTNVLRKAGVDIPVQPYSGEPYMWAKAHPDAWTITKPEGRPSTTATPPVGSLFMYGTGYAGHGSQHINMVEKTYPDGSFDLIGGNQGSGCPTGSCVSEHKSCKLVGWKTSTAPHVDCSHDRPIWGIVTPTKTKGTLA